MGPYVSSMACLQHRHVVPGGGVEVHQQLAVVADDEVVRDVLQAVLSGGLSRAMLDVLEVVLGLEAGGSLQRSLDVDKEEDGLVLVVLSMLFHASGGSVARASPGRVKVADDGLALADEVGELLGGTIDHGDVEVLEVLADHSSCHGCSSSWRAFCDA